MNFGQYTVVIKYFQSLYNFISILGDEITYFGNDNFYNDPKSKKRKGPRRMSKGSKKFKKH